MLFLFNSILLGTGLAMDAFSVSMVNGLKESEMPLHKMNLIAGVYAFFQFAMPMTGWICVHTILTYFKKFETFIPWIALILLLYIGGKMLIEGRRKTEEDTADNSALTFSTLIIQGIATSIDALSVGFTIANYALLMAVICSLIIAAVTYIISITGIVIGKKVGTKLSSKAAVLGGVILIAIGIEIFIKGIFF